MRLLISLVILGTVAIASWSADPAPERTVPATRPEMKKLLEELKKSKPRLPLKPLSAEEKEKQGDRPVVNNARLRQIHLPAELQNQGYSRERDANMTLDNRFKVMLFWIVSRGNNCHYCLGHQEWKLAVAGLSEARIAALDSAWDDFTPAEQAAFDFTRRLTHKPHTLTDAHLAALSKHYKPLQVLEIIFTVANNNSTNRWTDGFSIPLEKEGAFFARGKPKAPAVLDSFLTPTPDKFKTCKSIVAPLALAERPALSTKADAESSLAACRKRKPRLPLVDEDAARALLPRDWPAGALPQWVRLLANFSKSGPPRIVSLRTAEEKGTLDKRLRAKVWWIAARHDRAWYALGHARQRLLRLGVSEKEIWALDDPSDKTKAGERAAFSLARKVTTTPHKVTDDDIAVLRKHYTDGQVAELVYQLCTAAFFNRLTEAAGLQLEG